MKTLNNAQIVKIVDHFEDEGSVGTTQIYVPEESATEAHAHVLTSHEEEAGYSHFLTLYTKTAEVLAHELAHMHLHVTGRYKQDDQHGVEHTAATRGMLAVINTLL